QDHQIPQEQKHAPAPYQYQCCVISMKVLVLCRNMSMLCRKMT
ncbi:MAG: hypothetical protein ACI9IN_001411, partial [Porticoccaceae bacterium]